MDSSATSKRKLIPLVPDIAYHIQIVFILCFGYIWWQGFVDTEYLSNAKYDPLDETQWAITVQNWKRGIISVVIFLCSYSYLRPDSLDFFHPMQRFWRIMHMLTLIYFSGIILLLNHRPSYGRWVLGYFDKQLNADVTKGHHTYDDNCELEWANIWDNFDHYYCVHWGNWLLSSFVIRDMPVLHFWHIFNEIQELSWQHILPHFRECWWDHIIMDICLSNIPAVTTGLWIQSKIGLIRYDLLGRDGAKTFWDWKVLNCHKCFGIITYMFVLLYVFFLNGFFLNNNLLIPPVHVFPVLRLLMWFAIGAIGFREGYEDSRTWGTQERRETEVQGRYRWLATAILCSEAILCWKYRENTGHIDKEAALNTPAFIWGPHVFYLIASVFFWLYLRFKTGATTKYPVKASKKVKNY